MYGLRWNVEIIKKIAQLEYKARWYIKKGYLYEDQKDCALKLLNSDRQESAYVDKIFESCQVENIK